MQYLQQFSSENGIENNKVVKQRASIVAQGLRRYLTILQRWNLIPVTYIIGSTKPSISAVDRYSDRISMWITRFRHIWLIPDGISILNRNTKYNIHCVESVSHHTTYCCRYIWYNWHSGFLMHKDYSYNDDYPCLWVYNDDTCNHLNDEV